MKNKVFIFIFSLFAYLSFAQNRAVCRIDSLPQTGVVLDKGWKWQAGDDPEWAKADFDDSEWESIDPTNDIFDLPQVPKTGQIGWLRLHLTIHSTVLQNQLALIIQQSIASDYFLNGKLIHSFGKISANPSQIQAFDPLWKPVSFPMSKENIQILAIRFALEPGISYTKIFETSNPITNIQVLNIESAINIYTNIRAFTERYTMIQLGVWIMLFVINFIFFLANRNNKSRLYFSVFALLFLIGDVMQLNLYILEHDVANKFYVGNWVFVMYIFGEFSLMMAIYAVFERKRDLIFWIIFGYIIPAIFLDAFVYGHGWQFGGPMLEIFVHINIIRMAIIAVVKKKRSAIIIAVGAVASMLFFALFLRMGTFYNHYFLLSLTNLRSAYYFLFLFSIPIAANIYLGLDFAFINKILKQKLDENEKLSKEKQQILATQNETLEKQVTERTTELKNSLSQLKSTQSQLIQSEKLASLGEVTAGIAHEIQNPLNFVNNFAEISAEMLVEMEEEIDKGDTIEAKAIAADLKINLEKINHHGKRASNIVKGMLDHSRQGRDEMHRVSKDINALADEYLRLAYHGLRAKDSSFNATMETHFDVALPKIEVIPQDIGRVLLNLINNAFYAVNEKAKQGIEGYQPTVTVSTCKLDAAIEIKVQDNGNGIPDAIKEKIFQPFFTTKPTGQGTGLGLSLAYDIVVKGHRGKLEVESTEGEGTEFMVKLPI